MNSLRFDGHNQYYCLTVHIDLSSVIPLFIIFEWLIRVAALFVIPRNRKPSAAMGWLMLIMLEPTVGLLMATIYGKLTYNSLYGSKTKTSTFCYSAHMVK